MSKVFLALIILISAGGVFVLLNKNQEPPTSVISNISNILTPQTSSPTPFLLNNNGFPFQEMTIPYIRNREFKSKLGDLQKASENVSYTSFVTSYDSEDLKVYGLLTIPKGVQEPVQGWPAIVFIHGYIPPEEYRTTQNYLSYVDYLAKNGFVVFKIDLRGHGQSEGEAGGGYYSGDYVIVL